MANFMSILSSENACMNIVGVLVVFFICWLVLLELGYYFLGARVEARTLIVFAALGMVYNFSAGMVFPQMLYIVGLYVLYTILLWFSTKIHIINILFASFFTFLCTTLSMFIFGFVILLFKLPVMDFLMNTTVGFMVGVAFETLLPLIVWLVCWKLNITIFPRIERISGSVIWLLVMFVSIVLKFYHSVVVSSIAMQENVKSVLSMLPFEWFTLVSLLLCFFVVRTLIAKEESRIIADHKERDHLMSTFYQKKIDEVFFLFNQSSNHLIRNCFVFIQSLLNPEKELDFRVDDDCLAEVIYNVPFFRDFNPIGYFILVTKRIAAIHSGIHIILESNNGLKDCKDIRFWTIFSKLVDVLVRAQITLDQAEFGSPSGYKHWRQIRIVLEENPTVNIIRITTERKPKLLFSHTTLFKHHIDKADQEILEYLKGHSFSYGVYDGKMVEAQLIYDKTLPLVESEDLQERLV